MGYPHPTLISRGSTLSFIRFTLGAVLIAASYWVPMIIIGRLILGVGVGAAAVIAPL
jgi:SP family myo-inositol transporter-like MFS transporter 13